MAGLIASGYSDQVKKRTTKNKNKKTVYVVFCIMHLFVFPCCGDFRSIWGDHAFPSYNANAYQNLSTSVILLQNLLKVERL